ncbi:endopeptidase La [Permianibacter sp. IMCC34836]|uniref:endopeptidase La n=1 Tax=Permianibacter fluminis TaxID=2738515 RepID=UPI001552130B|nr:endopeptidase La [Permianibacter fluminis]NQD38112.1 endopeptidase La [Permianibacter fluminis]
MAPEPTGINPLNNDKAHSPVETYLPTELCLLPLAERPFFPPQTLPVLMNEEHWRETLDYIGHTEHRLAGLVLTKAAHPDHATSADFYEIGTVVRVHHPVVSSGKVQFIAEGLQRFRIREFISHKPPFLAKIDYPLEPRYRNVEQLKAYAVAIINTLRDMAPLNPLYSDELKFFLNRFNPNEPSPLADFAASLTTASREELQQVLETVHLRDRMEVVIELIKTEMQVARLQAKIREEVEERLSEHQRKFFLREQMKAIQRELGIAKDDRTADTEKFRERLEPLTVPAAPRQRIDEELDKLAVLEPGSPEYAVTRNWLDVATAVPWGKYSKDNLDLKRAQAVLEKDHAGLEDVKQRIIEFLAVGALKGEIAGSIVLLVGPPGVGKTSIGRSIAHALERKFYRFSVGGIRDEAEIKGHRRTYIGALPGKLIQALRECETMNPVVMLDEIDKIGSSYQGDPASALLEVLDPEQNSAFLDHYLDVRVDLSKVLFVCTANQLDTIPRPLLDRMEVIRLSGYITEEKMAIARDYLWPRTLERVGLSRRDVSLPAPALRKIIEDYAREAGVRNLEKQLGRMVRKIVVEKVNQKSPGKTSKVELTPERIEQYLGHPVFTIEKPAQGIGIVTGLAWTALGGSTLNIETAVVHHKQRGLKLTGTLGDVMKESAEIAYSYVGAHLADFGAKAEALDNSFIHIHVPEGATPKDGPSAGITLATALLSLARQQPLKRELAMTGELTLTGDVLAVGGIREKVVAARRVGIRELILPEACRGDYQELPAYIRKGLSVHFVRTYAEVAALCFSSRKHSK